MSKPDLLLLTTTHGETDPAPTSVITYLGWLRFDTVSASPTQQQVIHPQSPEQTSSGLKMENSLCRAKLLWYNHSFLKIHKLNLLQLFGESSQSCKSPPSRHVQGQLSSWGRETPWPSPDWSRFWVFFHSQQSGNIFEKAAWTRRCSGIQGAPHTHTSLWFPSQHKFLYYEI